MTLTTIFALFGDDLRLWMTDKVADPYFYLFFVVSLVLFSAELLLQSCVVDDFKYSFFLWLDLIATLSLVPDIKWIMSAIQRMLEIKESELSVDVLPGEELQATDNQNLAKVIKSVRLIRLIRIIKLYNYAVKSNTEAEEAKLRE
jgi:hypothetical protein